MPATRYCAAAPPILQKAARAVCWLRHGELHGRKYWPMAIVVRVGVAYGIRTASCTKELLPRQTRWNGAASNRHGRGGNPAIWTPRSPASHMQTKNKSLPMLLWTTTFGPSWETAIPPVHSLHEAGNTAVALARPGTMRSRCIS